MKSNPKLTANALNSLKPNSESPGWAKSPTIDEAKRYAFKAFMMKATGEKSQLKGLHSSWLAFLKKNSASPDPALSPAFVSGLVALDMFEEAFTQDEKAWVKKTIRNILSAQNAELKAAKEFLAWTQNLSLSGAYIALYGSSAMWLASFKRAEWILDRFITETGGVSSNPKAPDEPTVRALHYILQYAVLLDRNGFTEGKKLWNHQKLQALLRSIDSMGPGAVYAWEVASYFDPMYVNKVRTQLPTLGNSPLTTVGLCFHDALKNN
jgi:hypothetical protein